MTLKQAWTVIFGRGSIGSSSRNPRVALRGAATVAGARLQAMRQKFGERTKTKSEAMRHRIAYGQLGRALEARIRRARPTRPFYLCPLCELIVQGHQWHRPCQLAWWGWCRRLGGYPCAAVQPPPLRRRGPSPKPHLARNYVWLMARYKREKNRAELLAASGRHKTGVTKAIQSFIRRLPGSWDLVFSWNATVRRTNRARQEVLQLPLALQRMTGAGARDPLIERLHGFGMPMKKIALVTGASVDRIRGILSRLEPRENKSA